MKITEQVSNLNQKSKELTEQITTTKSSLADITDKLGDQECDTCKICGAKKGKYKLSNIELYTSCTCRESEPLRKRQLQTITRYQNLEAELENIDLQIRRFTELSKKLIEESNLGRRFTDRTFDNFKSVDHPEALKASLEFAKKFEDNKGEGLLFTGSPGTGKTHLAAAITNYIVSEFGIPVKFGNFTDILDGIKSNFGKADAADLIKTLSEVPLLVIDDLGKERKTEWSNSVLYQVINRRYENYMPIVITTNETIKSLTENIGEATMSRLFEMCKGVKMDGKDYRKSKLA